MKRIFKILISAVTLLMVAAVSLSIYLDSFYWENKSSLASPDDSITVYEYYNMGDGDRHAPYGTYLFMQPSFNPMPAYKSYVIFAGYCNNKVEYTWLNNKQINISCQTDDPDSIRSQSKKAFGVNITVSSK